MMVHLGHQAAMLRGLVIGRLGRSGHKATVDKARELFAAHQANPAGGALPADVRGAAYSIVLKFGDASTIDQMLALYRAADTQEEKERVLRVLGSVESEELKSRVLKFSLSVYAYYIILSKLDILYKSILSNTI